MPERVFQEENHRFQFDFSSAFWATNEVHDKFQQNKASLLSDADFVLETADSIIVLEYKNANILGAARPQDFCPSDQKSLNKIAYKYYDTWIYLELIGKNKPITYVYILEYPNGDSVTRRAIRNRILDLLPFELQRLPEAKKSLITHFEVLSIAEWNAHDVYQLFPISPIEPT